MSGETERVAADLRATLARLHAELGRSPTVDAESRRLLAELSADIERVLGAPAATPVSSAVPVRPDPDPDPGSGTAPRPDPDAAGHEPRLEALAVRFEAQHPDLAGSLRQLVDLLGRAGI